MEKNLSSLQLKSLATLALTYLPGQFKHLSIVNYKDEQSQARMNWLINQASKANPYFKSCVKNY